MEKTYISELDLYVRIKQEPKRNQTGIRFYDLNSELVLSYRFNKIDFKTAGFGIGRYLIQIAIDFETKTLPYGEVVGNYSLKGEK